MAEIAQEIHLAQGGTFTGFLVQATCSMVCPFGSFCNEGGDCSNPDTPPLKRTIGSADQPCQATPPLQFVYKEAGHSSRSSTPYILAKRSGTIWKQVKR